MTTNAEGTTTTTNDAGAPAGTVVPPADEGEIIVAIGAEPSLGSEATDDELIDGQPAPQWAKDLRKKAREDAKLIRDLETRVTAAERKPAPNEPAAIVVGDKPSLESCEFDADKFEKELLAWTDRKAKAEQQERDRTARQTEQQTAYGQRLNAYRNGALALKVADFDASEKAIELALTPIQQSIIVKLAKDSALFVYALGRDPAKLKELAAVTDPVAFAYQIAATEKEIKTMPKSKFQPETRPAAGGGGGTLPAGSSAALEAARKKAADTNDYTEVNRIRRELDEAARQRRAAG